MIKLVLLYVVSLKVQNLLTVLSEDLLYFHLRDLKVNGVRWGHQRAGLFTIKVCMHMYWRASRLPILKDLLEGLSFSVYT